MNRKSVSLSLGIAFLACLPAAAQTYTFTDVKFPGDTFTQFLSINDMNIVAGYHGAATTAANPNKGFTYNFATKKFTNENFPGSVQTQVTGINDPPAKTVGFYIDTAGRTHGFQEFAGVFTREDQPGTPFNQLLGQNNVGQAAGYYSTTASGSGPDHGYILDEFGNVYQDFVIPGTVSVQATSINGLGNVCGFFVDSKQVTHGWLLVQGMYTVLNFPRATSTSAFGLNMKNQVVGAYTDAAGNSHGFIYNTLLKTWKSVDDPNGIGTTVVNGINEKGVLVGFWGTSPTNTAFVAVPR